MDNVTIIQAVTAAGVVIAMLVNLATLRRTSQSNNPHNIEMRADIKHIREKVDKQGVMTEQLDEKHDKLRDRVAKVEASASSAHKRLDDLKK